MELHGQIPPLWREFRDKGLQLLFFERERLSNGNEEKNLHKSQQSNSSSSLPFEIVIRTTVYRCSRHTQSSLLLSDNLKLYVPS